MDMPTGFGKTYNVIRYIFDASTNDANKDRKYFFITTLKKNPPKADLEKWFRDAGKLDQFLDVTFARNGQLTVVPFPFKYLREYVLQNYGDEE
ncbi:MAG: hypothetical protein II777_05545 [Clostridia bacterium]|nr:hypothetical protein [Clostridia bacterium]